MKTSYYTYTTWDDGAMAAGFDSGLRKGRQNAVCVQTGGADQGMGKIIDLNTWRAANLEEAREEPELGWEPGEDEWESEAEDELPPPAPRPRKSRRSMLTAELVSTLSVVAAAVALVIRVLTF